MQRKLRFTHFECMLRCSLFLHKVRSSSGANIIPAYHHSLSSSFVSPTTLVSVPEPIEVWLRCIAAGAPFYNKVALVVPDDADNSNKVAMRASNHFDKVYTTPLKQLHNTRYNAMDFGSSPVPTSAEGKGDIESSEFIFDETLRDLLLTDSKVETTSEKGLVTVSSNTSLIPRLYQSPFSSNTVMIEDASVDMVIFASNSFGELATSPDTEIVQKIMSDATRKLKAHGVVEVIGMLPFLQLGSATEDTSDESELYRELRQDYNDFKEMVCSKDFLSPMESSTLIAHDDVYFPFRYVNKQFYVSEYEVTVPQLIAHIRGWECYRKMMTPTMDSDALGVYRRSVCGDPLRDLEDCMVAHLVKYHGSGRNPEVRLPNYKLRVSATHFVISCTNRHFHHIDDRSSRGRITPRDAQRRASLSSSSTIPHGYIDDGNSAEDIGLVPTSRRHRHHSRSTSEKSLR